MKFTDKVPVETREATCDFCRCDAICVKSPNQISYVKEVYDCEYKFLYPKAGFFSSSKLYKVVNSTDIETEKIDIDICKECATQISKLSFKL